MAKPFSDDLRERIVRAVKAGRSRHEVGRIFGVSPSCVIKLMGRYRESGDFRPHKFGGYKKPILIGHEQTVRSLVSARPDLTISDLRNELTARGIKVGRFLQRLELTFKKKPARRRTAAA
jgi:transposase